MKNIIHLSDLHFRSSQPLSINPDIVINSIVETIRSINNGAENFLCITGDIVFQCDHKGYNMATAFVRKLCESAEINTENIILCPGNHDLNTKNRNFDGYNKFAFELSRNEDFLFGNRDVSFYKIKGLSFILINSSYHLSHQYGQVNLDSLEKAFEAAAGNPYIVCLHHHLIPTNEHTCLINSYDFIRLCISRKPNLILHGHRHMNTILEVGHCQLTICGSGSLFFSHHRSGYSNQFQILTIDGSKTEISVYRYLVDSESENRKFTVEKIQS